jgi:transcriptional regulator with XRE-family HTH domain
VLADSTAESVGARLRRLRLERGISQRDLSSPGVSYAYISRIEAGARTPSVKALRKLARKLAVSVEYLETGNELREVDNRSIRLADAELELRLADDVSGTERKLEELLAESVEAGDTLSAVRARVALGLASARQGKHLEAVERLEAAVAEEDAPPPHLRPDLYAALGETYAALGAPERATRVFENCLTRVRAEARGDTTAELRYSTLLGYALAAAGQMTKAAEVVLAALSRTREEKDQTTRIREYWSLGRRSLAQGRSADAIEYLRIASALARARDDELALARAGEGALQWAGFLRERGRSDEAETIRRRAYDLGVGVKARPTGLS